MLWLDVFLGWFLLWVLLIFLLVRVTVDIFGSRIRMPGGEVGWLPSFRDRSGRFWVFCLRSETRERWPPNWSACAMAGLSVLSGCKEGPAIGRWPDLPGGGRADTECCSGDVGRAQAGEPSGLSLISAAG
jgi:hypothetical protein